MARPLRIELPGALHHVMARGDDRLTIFPDDQDRSSFLGRLDRVGSRLGWTLWAYCLMSTHYHLLVETAKGTLSRGMRDLNGAYSQGFNRRHDRVGHVFQGRFKSLLVDRQSYLLEVSRYIVNNPVDSGLCRRPRDWPWSSYRDVMGERPSGGLTILCDNTLQLFGQQTKSARAAFARFVAQRHPKDDLLAHVRHQIFLGDEDFVAATTRQLSRPSREVPRAQCAWRSLADLARAYPGRNDGIRAAYADGGHTITAIARFYGLHYSTVSKIVRAAGDSQFKT